MTRVTGCITVPLPPGSLSRIASPGLTLSIGLVEPSAISTLVPAVKLCGTGPWIKQPMKRGDGPPPAFGAGCCETRLPRSRPPPPEPTPRTPSPAIAVPTPTAVRTATLEQKISQAAAVPSTAAPIADVIRPPPLAASAPSAAAVVIAPTAEVATHALIAGSTTGAMTTAAVATTATVTASATQPQMLLPVGSLKVTGSLSEYAYEFIACGSEVSSCGSTDTKRPVAGS